MGGRSLTLVSVLRYRWTSQTSGSLRDGGTIGDMHTFFGGCLKSARCSTLLRQLFFMLWLLTQKSLAVSCRMLSVGVAVAHTRIHVEARCRTSRPLSQPQAENCFTTESFNFQVLEHT